MNCRWVDRCQAYHSVERQHGATHLNLFPDIEPKEPCISISVIEMPDGQAGVEWDVRSCGSFLEDHGRWQRLRPGQDVPT